MGQDKQGFPRQVTGTTQSRSPLRCHQIFTWDTTTSSPINICPRYTEVPETGISVLWYLVGEEFSSVSKQQRPSCFFLVNLSCEKQIYLSAANNKNKKHLLGSVPMSIHPRVLDSATKLNNAFLSSHAILVLFTYYYIW